MPCSVTWPNKRMQVTTLIRMTIHQVGQLEYGRAAAAPGRSGSRRIAAPPNNTRRVMDACQPAVERDRKSGARSKRRGRSGGGIADNGLLTDFGDLSAPLVRPVRRRWLQAEHLDVLCDELLAMHAIMEASPKNAGKVCSGQPSEWPEQHNLRISCACTHISRTLSTVHLSTETAHLLCAGPHTLRACRIRGSTHASRRCRCRGVRAHGRWLVHSGLR